MERTVAEVLPALTKNQGQISSTVEMLNKNLLEKGKNLNDYREKHNITVRGENPSSGGNAAANTQPTQKSNQSSGVLVSNK